MSTYGWTEQDLLALERRARRRHARETAPQRGEYAHDHSYPVEPCGKVENPGGFGSEADLQRAVAQWLDANLAENARWFHCPNGGRRSAKEAARLKGQGVKAGVPDVCIVGMTLYGSYEPHWIELKLPDGRLRKAQREWRDWCRETGQPWALCRSLTEVAEQVEEWGLIEGRAA